jgi:hypothetical protein
MSETPKVVYRYDGYEYLQVTEFKILKETPKGYWIEIDDYTYPKMWIAKDARRSFAYTTIEAARISYRKRKVKHIEKLEAQLKKAKQGLKHAMAGMFDEKAKFQSELDRESEISMRGLSK